MGTLALINLLIVSILSAGAVFSLLCRRCDKVANVLGLSSCILALLLKLFAFKDTLSMCFQLPIVIVGIAAALHSIGYMEHHGHKRMSVYWFLFNMMLMAMMLVTMLPKGFCFLAAWELMGLTSFALVAFEWRRREVMTAAWVYLLACEAGGLLLLWLLMNNTISFGVMLTVTVVAFGLKAGFPLLHVWLPEAHPAAPAPVSAVMSGAMIPLGFYGIVSWCPEVLNSVAAAWTFFLLGIAGMLMGILFGAAQSNLKRLLAYSSVENIGIMTLAFSLGILGVTNDNSFMAVLGFLGCILHMINHALLKGTLFLGAGSVYKAMGTLEMDAMGGLMRKMPWTGTMFTLSALGISGLPPFCGFAGELLIYMAAFQGIARGSGLMFAACSVAVVALALTGGIAVAAFAKTVAAVFSGEPRTAEAENAAQEESRMIVPIVLIGSIALLMTFAAPWLMTWLLFQLFGYHEPELGVAVFMPLAHNGLFALLLLVLTTLFFWLRKVCCRRCDGVGLTWDCGYAAPTARMQYTATAFVQPLADLFNTVLRQKKRVVKPENLFPEEASFEVETPDGGSRCIWNPLFSWANYLSDRVKHLQSGLLHVYILIMVLAILLMLCWSFGFEKSHRVAAEALPEVNITAGEVVSE